MKVLGIETSCDETALALIEASGDFSSLKVKILSDLVASQIKVHQKYGGIVPSLAKREHSKNLPILWEKISSLKEKPELIAITIGPGLSPCLWEGINFAKKISKKLNLPMVGVNHLEGHLFSVFLKKPLPQFPLVSLIISGGHTLLVFSKKPLSYKILGETKDDAVGEAFDKVGRMLGFTYPAGKEIEKMAKKGKAIIDFPSPMINQKNYDFSYAGLKTAVLYYLKKHFKSKEPENVFLKESFIVPEKDKAQICASFQKAAFKVLIEKTLRAAKEFKVKSIVVCGGVAANEFLKKEFKKRAKENLVKAKIFFPEKKFATDNAVMIALAGYFHRKEIKKRLVALPNLKL
ncbi:tRNA (adenosine(37)-N6)-threonylcarbamoyltransferase complex transferase subunit TsaD [bacterium]|nr:tRNA (adenosine(37)-N6)-threonylcarbamoyltransferase complex transferase subunit TsaD [bacterium]